MLIAGCDGRAEEELVSAYGGSTSPPRPGTELAPGSTRNLVVGLVTAVVALCAAVVYMSVPYESALTSHRGSTCVEAMGEARQAVSVKDLAGARAPFARAGVLCVLATLVLVLQGAYLFVNLAMPMVRELEQRARRYRDLVEMAGSAVVCLTPGHAILGLNAAAEGLLGRDRASALGEDFLALSVPAPARAALAAAVLKAFEGRGPVTLEGPVLGGDGEGRTVLWSLSVLPSSDGADEVVVAVGQDVTANKRAEAERDRARRALRVSNDCSHALLRARDEGELLATVCRALVDAGGYRLACVVRAERDEARTVTVRASAGSGDGDLAADWLTWADGERGRCPLCAALRRGTLQVCRHMATDPAAAPWRGEAQRRGFASCLALPLIGGGGRLLGALGIFAAASDAFDRQETALLQRLAADLAHGLGAVREREARAQAQEALSEPDASSSDTLPIRLLTRSGVTLLARTLVESPRRLAAD